VQNGAGGTVGGEGEQQLKNRTFGREVRKHSKKLGACGKAVWYFRPERVSKGGRNVYSVRNQGKKGGKENPMVINAIGEQTK